MKKYSSSIHVQSNIKLILVFNQWNKVSGFYKCEQECRVMGDKRQDGGGKGMPKICFTRVDKLLTHCGRGA